MYEMTMEHLKELGDKALELKMYYTAHKILDFMNEDVPKTIKNLLDRIESNSLELILKAREEEAIDIALGSSHGVASF